MYAAAEDTSPSLGSPHWTLLDHLFGFSTVHSMAASSAGFQWMMIRSRPISAMSVDEEMAGGASALQETLEPCTGAELGIVSDNALGLLLLLLLLLLLGIAFVEKS